MLFEDYHLFEFEAGGRCYDVPDPEDLYERKTFAARNVRITALIQRGIATFSYTYDFGDNCGTLSRSRQWRMETPASNIRASSMVSGERRRKMQHLGVRGIPERHGEATACAASRVRALVWWPL
jgi:hypothetical protein